MTQFSEINKCLSFHLLCSGAPVSAGYQQQTRVGPLAGGAGSLNATDITGANLFFLPNSS